jgi:hypothetical protein
VHCGKHYGQRAVKSETIRYTEEPPVYVGDQIVVEYTKPYRSSDGEMSMSRKTWDGRTYHTLYDPFCTLRCALDYARLAFRRMGPIK